MILCAVYSNAEAIKKSQPRAKTNQITANGYNSAFGINAISRLNIVPKSVDGTRLADKTIGTKHISAGSITDTELAASLKEKISGSSENISNCLVKRNKDGSFKAKTIYTNLQGNIIGDVEIQGNITNKPALIEHVANAANLMFIDSNGKIGTIASSNRYKDNIKKIETASMLYALEPVSFNYKNIKESERTYGLIAEEVAKIAPELVILNENKEPEAVAYHLLIPLLLKAYQEQKTEIELLKKNIYLLKDNVNSLSLLLTSTAR